MRTLTGLAPGAMGKLRPHPAQGDATARIEPSAADQAGGPPLMQALARCRSARAFARRDLPLLASLLWATNGVNRADGQITAPSDLNVRQIDIHVVLRSGAYRYDAAANAMALIAAGDVGRVAGNQDLVDQAPLNLVYVADHGRMTLVPAGQRDSFAAVAAGAVTQNVCLFAACNGPATVIRAWLDRDAIAAALGLHRGQAVQLAQTVGFPASSRA